MNNQQYIEFSSGFYSAVDIPGFNSISDELLDTPWSRPWTWPEPEFVYRPRNGETWETAGRRWGMANRKRIRMDMEFFFSNPHDNEFWNGFLAETTRSTEISEPVFLLPHSGWKDADASPYGKPWTEPLKFLLLRSHFELRQGEGDFFQAGVRWAKIWMPEIKVVMKDALAAGEESIMAETVPGWQELFSTGFRKRGRRMASSAYR